jgi:hypothetical protein
VAAETERAMQSVPVLKRGRLPRRDLILLPLISLLTIAVLLGISEIGARIFFATSGAETCGAQGAIRRMRPNCIAHQKAAEGPDVEMAYNNCGYRSPESCGAKPPSAIRIALLGSSTAQGFKAPYAASFAAGASAVLTQMCGRPVEIQNMGVPGSKPLDSYLRVDEALAMEPDLVVMVVVPYDLEQFESRIRLANRRHPERLQLAEEPAAAPLPVSGSLLARFNDLVNVGVRSSRAVLVAEHFLFQRPETFVQLQLAVGDKADYLRSEVPPNWRQRYQDLELLIGEMADKIHQAGHQFLLVLGTELAQADLAHLTSPPPGTDPAAAGQQLALLAERHHVLFLDTLDGFKAADPTALFYPADGHMSPEGHAVFATSLVRRLTEGDIAAFAGCAAAIPSTASARRVP